MSKDQEQDPFSQFEVEEVPDEEAQQTPIWEQDSTRQTIHVSIDATVEKCLHIVFEVLHGNLAYIMAMSQQDRVILATAIQGILSQPNIGKPPTPGTVRPGLGDLGYADDEETPSAKAAKKVQQTPEEAQREKDFLDMLSL